jgi:signal peptidase II
MPVLIMGLLTDQASKSWASYQAAEPIVLVTGYLAACSVPNAGGILGYGGDYASTRFVLALLGIASAMVLVQFACADRWRWQGPEFLAGALMLAGIVGNTVDRLALGHVRDFLVTWATPTLVFNVADLLVAVGSVFLLMARCSSSWRSRSGLKLQP